MKKPPAKKAKGDDSNPVPLEEIVLSDEENANFDDTSITASINRAVRAAEKSEQRRKNKK